MTFAWPNLLWLVLAPAMLLAWELSHRRRAAAGARPKILRAEAGVRSLKLSAFEARPVAPGSRPRWWLCLGLALGIVALARPQWGRLEEPVFDQSREILLAIDLSRSMLTPDVRPSRLDRGKLLIQSLLEKLVGERVGLVVFSGTSFLQSPLSADYEILREFLPALSPEFLPEGGSNYGALIQASVGAFAGSATADRFLIILSDGEATDENWRSRVADLKAKGVRVIGLGIGTPAGAMIPDSSGGFIKDERGAVVLSKLESGTLQELAQATNGVYRDASSWVDLASLLEETVETGRKGQFVEKETVRLVERFQWPLAFGLWCLLVSFCYEFPVRPRPREIRLAAQNKGRKTEGSEPTTVKPTAAAVAGVFGLLFSAFCFTALSSPFSVYAAATPVTAPPTTAAPTPPPNAPPSSALATMVGRLANAESRSARDWAEFGRETVTWGSRLQSEQQPVPEGAVRDALAAVDLGSKLDAKTTDWPKLREELEDLLKKPDEQKQDQNGDQSKDEKEQKKQDDKGEQKTPDQQGKPDEPPPPEKPDGEPAFGDMQPKDEPPPPPEDTQKVGGAQEKQDEPKEPVDPALALPMQKLDLLRDQDSPAQLFQLMDGEPKPTKKPAKDY